MERLDLLHQRIGEALTRDVGDGRDVVDRLFRIELAALATDLVEDVDEVRLDVEKTEFEDGEQAHRARADYERVGLDRLTHPSLPPRPEPRFYLAISRPTH